MGWGGVLGEVYPPSNAQVTYCLQNNCCIYSPRPPLVDSSSQGTLPAALDNMPTVSRRVHCRKLIIPTLFL